ncbi:hypothetical protein RJ639_019437 [Escallonia herrerae]|uniref:Replication protein A OB domain-containing protein n=1 Tax=Escallonia herrerae TaxID=1293975 RepID=A0AA88V6Q0_9ASTE|nr:hypothetical protein RJ639_019437 [Escallonia herrerae]
MDEEGTKIQAIVFNDVADILQQSLQKDKTYLISTGLVKPVNPQFDSAHKRFELTFSSGTQVKELETNIDIAQLRLQFVSFKDLKHHIEHNDIIDVVGLLGDIDNLSLLKKPGGGGIMKRDMILTNTEYDTVVITLWSDLAKNEGNALSEVADDKPIVILSKAKVTRYGGIISLSTLSITTLHINPALPEVEALKAWYMLKLTVGDGVRNVYVTLFEAAERITNCAIDKKSDRIGQRLIAEEVHRDTDGVSLKGTKGIIDLENTTSALQNDNTSLKNQKLKAIKEGEQYAKENGMLFFETSAKAAQNTIVFKYGANCGSQRNFYLLCDDDRCIDIELCPRCEKLRFVYDNPTETCQAKDNTADVYDASGRVIYESSACITAILSQVEHNLEHTRTKGLAYLLCLSLKHIRMYHGDKVWEHPKEWRPERFLDKNNDSVDLYKMMAFGGGKRVCAAGALQTMPISRMAIGRFIQEFDS